MNFSEKSNFIFEGADGCMRVGGRVGSHVTLATLKLDFQ